MDAGQQPLDVGEHLLVPVKAAPLVPLGHPVDEAGDGLFVVAGGKAAGQPQPEGPGRGQGGPAGQGGVVLQHGLRFPAADDHEAELLAGDAELDAGDVLAAHLKADRAAVVDQDAVTPVGQVEGDVLVADLAGGAAVLVPDIHHLAVFYKGGEALAQAVDLLAHVHLQLAAHERPFRGGDGAELGDAVAAAHRGDPPAPIIIGEGAGVLCDDQLQFAARNGVRALPFFKREGFAGLVQLEGVDLRRRALEVDRLHLQNIPAGGR